MKKNQKWGKYALICFAIVLGTLFTSSCSMGNDWEIKEGTYVQDFYIDAIAIGDRINVSYDYDFDKSMPRTAYDDNFIITTDKILEQWINNPYKESNILSDKHGKVCALSTYKTNSVKLSKLEISINVSKESVLTFNFKSDTVYSDSLCMKVDNSKPFRIGHAGSGQGWRKLSIPLKRGNHNITWFVPKDYMTTSKGHLNVIYLDNITVTPKKIEFVEVYPKGKQETYVGGFPIQFRAIALRGDRTVAEAKNVEFDVTGPGKITKNGVFVPTSEGTYTVIATVDGKISYSETITVHGENYLSDQVNIGGESFTGFISNDNGNKFTLSKEDEKKETVFVNPTPLTDKFSTDGFFVIKGNAKTPLLINVKKSGTEHETNYLVRKVGDFYKRIWLRFGNGEYDVSIFEDPNMNFYDTKDSKYEGDVKDIGANKNTNKKIIRNMKVSNTNTMLSDKAIRLLPSEYVQSDSLLVSNAVSTIKGSLNPGFTDGDLLRAIHDWQIHNLYFDRKSELNTDLTKRQDADHVIMYGTGLANGYSNLYAALLRNAGFETKVMSNSSKTWNNVYYNNNRYLIDTAKDDPAPYYSDATYNDKNIGSENYTYFMLNTNPPDYKGTEDTSR